jgi:MarR family transcriptional regulator, organic hydroperoxide resistance regulator
MDGDDGRGSQHGDAPLADSDPRAVLHEFMRLMHLQRLLLFRAFAREEMPPGQAHCLRVLGQSGPITQSGLAEIMVLSRPTVTRLVQRMERTELIWRRTDPGDQRLTRVGLTEAGEQRVAGMDAALREYMNATLARLPEDDRQHLARTLRAWRDLADEALLRSPSAQGSPGQPDDTAPCSPRGSVE